MRRPRVALIVHRFGSDIYGGEVTLSGAVARSLGAHADVRILTTCARDYMSWRNEYPSGHATVNGIHVHRFNVDRKRDVRAFDAYSRELLADPEPRLEDEERWMRMQGPISTALEQHIESFCDWYDAYIFFSYLYATTYFLLPLVDDRAFLFPLLHDEWPVRFSMWDRFFERPRQLIYCSPEEREFAERRFPLLKTRATQYNVGLTARDGDARRFREHYALGDERFVLYVGRIDESKGCEELIRDFARYRQRGGKFRTLILAGEQHMPIPPLPGIQYLGVLDDVSKWDAMAASDVVMLPSHYESLSLSVLEAWASGKPVACSAWSPVLVEQCRRSQGGLWFANNDELDVVLDTLFDRDLATQLGNNGRNYVSERHSSARSADSLASVVFSR